MTNSEIISPKQRFEKRLNLGAEVSEEVYRSITQIDIVKGQWGLTNSLSPQIITRLTTHVLLTSAGASNRIEGNPMTDDEVKALYGQLNIKKFKNRAEEEVAGYIEVLQNIFDSHQTISLNESSILHIHKELLKYVHKDSRHRGQYKFESNQVQATNSDGNVIGIIFDPTPPHLVKKELLELIEFTNKALATNYKHPLILIANFIFEYLAIHPFRDGNGRSSRLLTNLLMLQSEYGFVPVVSLDKIVEENKADYYLSLNQTQKSWKTGEEDISPFLLFFLKAVWLQSEKALALLSKDDTSSFLSEKQLQVWEYAQSTQEFSRADAIKATNLPPRTVEHSIKKLLDMNKLQKLGEGRSTRYKVKVVTP